MGAAVHPALLAATWVISSYATTGTPTWALWRPLLVMVAVTLVLQALATLASRRVWVGAFVASAVAMLVAGMWELAVALALPPAVWIAVVSLGFFMRRRWQVDGLGRKLGAIAGAASLIALVGTVTQAGMSGAFWWVARSDPAHGVAQEGAPDIYLVMLDGYPRSDVLASHFGIDNSSFDRALERRGFEVASASRSNYSITWLTLASVFQMAYAHELPALANVPERGPEQYRVFGELVNRSSAFDALRAHGYRIVVSPSPFSEIEIVTADEPLPIAGRTWFESELVAESPLSDLLAPFVRSWALDERRMSVDVGFARLLDTARRRGDAPIFMFDHIVSPHAPFVFRADGSPRALPACYPTSCVLFESNPRRLGLSREAYSEALSGQIAHLNERLLETLDALIAARPDAAVVLFSDHGTRYDLRADPGEATRNLFASRTPTAPGLFGNDPHLVNLLPTLLNEYIGANFATLRYEAWVSTGYPLMLTPLESAGTE